MLRLDNRHMIKIDSVFVFAVFTMFAVTGFLLILIGARQYQFTADMMDQNYDSRTVSSYLTEKIRQSDSNGQISISAIEDIPALCLASTENATTYQTYIYYHNGALCEIVVNNTSVFSPDSGEKILALDGFELVMMDDSLLQITFTTTKGVTRTLCLPIQSNTGKEYF